MPEEKRFRARYARQVGTILDCLIADRIPIIAVTLLIGLIGAVAGKLTDTTSSSAQLLMTPLPLESIGEDEIENLARMAFEPMDVKTASLICMSDEVIRRTRDRLNESGPQTSPTNALQELRDALEVRVTVSKEAPYDMIYSPVLVLTARAKTPAEAKLTVDTWALECVSTAKQYKDARHVPLVEALQGQTDAMLARLEEAEARVEAFRRDNNLEYIQNRLSGLITLTTGYLDRRADAEQDLFKERARHESLAASGSGVNRTQELAFTVPAEFLALLRKPLGLSGEDTVETKKQDLSATWEVLDPMYQQAARSGADAAGYEARLLMIDEALKAFNTELPNLQAEMARISRTDNELTRDAEILREAFGNAALQFEYAKLLAGLDHSELQLLSEGAEWRLSPFRRAIIMGCGGALWGFILAAAVSLLARIVVQPALESSE